MSAIQDGEPLPQGGGLSVTSFTQEVPIPSYLIAIAVGALDCRTISSRCKVWSERELVEKAAYEFGEVGYIYVPGFTCN